MSDERKWKIIPITSFLECWLYRRSIFPPALGRAIGHAVDVSSESDLGDCDMWWLVVSDGSSGWENDDYVYFSRDEAYESFSFHEKEVTNGPSC